MSRFTYSLSLSLSLRNCVALTQHLHPLPSQMSSASPPLAVNSSVRRIALLTAGGLAPCLSSAVGCLIERYSEVAPWVDIIAYRGGYRGLLLGDSFVVGRLDRDEAFLLHSRGGSPIGNSRVKLTNAKDCAKRGLVKAGENPLKVAADQLVADRVDVLHTIGGDDTNTAAADLAAYLGRNQYQLLVIGLPKTIDNDVFPIRQTLGAWTAAEEGARFFRNVVADHAASHRTLIVHEVMGRNCGWLTAHTALEYAKLIGREEFADGTAFNVSRDAHSVHAVYLPEVDIDLDAEAARLKEVMDRCDSVNIFISEGAGAESIAAQLRKEGREIEKDAFGHMKLDAVNVGKWFGERFAKLLGAEKLLVQKSGYYARAAKASARDLTLIKACCDEAVTSALRGRSGVIGHDEDYGDLLRPIEFTRIKGHKSFDVTQPWFVTFMSDVVRQPPPAKSVSHTSAGGGGSSTQHHATAVQPSKL